ncbi:MAG: hypothetical protein U5K54_03960 [Cytophagales bacterium]|nr:hypothetical protein [Cytophagales bacterium]
MKAATHNTASHPNDLVLFTPGVKPLPETLYLNGTINGKVSPLPPIKTWMLQSATQKSKGNCSWMA